MGLKPAIVDEDDAVGFPQIKSGVQFKHVTFSYASDEPQSPHKAAIQNVTFDIPFGKQTALVGHSGAGKSTITDLLDRLYDVDSGDILFDGIPIKHIKLKSLRQNIAIVSQDIFIIDGTIADNIRYGTPGATEDQLWNVAKLADIDAFIKGLPEQMKTQVGERGIRLSGGQKQRTSLVIAHRLSTIHNADQILVVDNGKIVERGTHDQLMNENGYYKQLYEAQFE